MCPGCGRSGVSGGVRCDDGGADKDGGEQEVKQLDVTHTAVPTDHINQAALCTQENPVAGTVGVSATGRAGGSGKYSTPRSSPMDISSCTDCASANGTFHTSLGVIIDVCAWRQQGDAKLAGNVRGDRDGASNDCSPECANGKHDMCRTATISHNPTLSCHDDIPLHLMLLLSPHRKPSWLTYLLMLVKLTPDILCVTLLNSCNLQSTTSDVDRYHSRHDSRLGEEAEGPHRNSALPSGAL